MPVKLPPWLEMAVAPESQSAESLVGHKILYKWQRNLGGWACGEISAVNHDNTVKMGKEMCNFMVHYAVDDDTSEHLLKTEHYALNAKAVPGSWVLLGKEE